MTIRAGGTGSLMKRLSRILGSARITNKVKPVSRGHSFKGSPVFSSHIEPKHSARPCTTGQSV